MISFSCVFHAYNIFSAISLFPSFISDQPVKTLLLFSTKEPLTVSFGDLQSLGLPKELLNVGCTGMIIKPVASDSVISQWESWWRKLWYPWLCKCDLKIIRQSCKQFVLSMFITTPTKLPNASKSQHDLQDQPHVLMWRTLTTPCH